MIRKITNTTSKMSSLQSLLANSGSSATPHPATRLRQLLSQPGVCVQAPGVYDGICARLAIEQGFQVMVRSLHGYKPQCYCEETYIRVTGDARSCQQFREGPAGDADAQYMSGAMTTAARLGKADLAFASLNDFAQNGQMLANIDPRVPLIADADTGFGSPPNIARMVQVYHQSGIAGFHIEDQVMNKRCGHLKGKQLVDLAYAYDYHEQGQADK